MTVTAFLIFILYFIIFLLLLWATTYLGRRTKETWMSFVRANFFSNQKYNLFEISIPKGQTKSPLSMELFMNSLFQPFGEAKWYDRWIKGATKAWFSLEIVSIEGRTAFYIWTREAHSNMIRTQLYAQFPDIGIKEIYQGDYKNDYVAGVNYDLSKYKFWCGEFRKKNAGHLPIKTYVDYGLDKDPKEEFKIDPITPVLEYMGSLIEGEHAWLQIGVRAPGKDFEKKLPTDSKERAKFKKANKMRWYQRTLMVDWTDAAKEDIKKLLKRDQKVDKENPVNMFEMRLTKQEEEKVTAIERGLSKLALDTTIRAVYVAKKDVFSPASSSGLMGTMRQYNTQHLNSFEVKAPIVKYAWMDKSGRKVNSDRESIFNQYKSRAFFYGGTIPASAVDIWKTNKYETGKPFIMTVEELATIFHFPGDTATTSNVSRVEAKKVEAPSNLPI
jgi:hypothetical protein